MRHTFKVSCVKPQRQGREGMISTKEQAGKCSLALRTGVPGLEPQGLSVSTLSFKKGLSKAGIGTGEVASAPLSPRMLSRRVLSGLLWPQRWRLGRRGSLCLFLCRSGWSIILLIVWVAGNLRSGERHGLELSTWDLRRVSRFLSFAVLINWDVSSLLPKVKCCHQHRVSYRLSVYCSFSPWSHSLWRDWKKVDIKFKR